MNSLAQIAQVILERDELLLVGHSIPDGDCVGSLLGLYLGLVSIGKRTRVFMQDQVPAIYRFLPGADQVLGPNQVGQPESNLIYLDCSDQERVGETAAVILAGEHYIINIDHHPSNTRFGQMNYVDEKSSSTAELVFALLQHLQVEIDSAIANTLYIGVFQDTGGFQHSSTNPSTFRTAAVLLEKGVDLDQIKHQLFESKSVEELLLLSLALRSLSSCCEGRIVWMILDYRDVAEINALDICPEGIINNTLAVKGARVGMLFRELSPGTIKVGFRSKGGVDVAALASRFGGGGHFRAAGAQLTGTMEDVQREVILAVESVVA